MTPPLSAVAPRVRLSPVTGGGVGAPAANDRRGGAAAASRRRRGQSRRGRYGGAPTLAAALLYGRTVAVPRRRGRSAAATAVAAAAMTPAPTQIARSPSGRRSRRWGWGTRRGGGEGNTRAGRPTAAQKGKREKQPCPLPPRRPPTGRRSESGRRAAAAARRYRQPFPSHGAGADATAVPGKALPSAEQEGGAGVTRGGAQGLVCGVGVGKVADVGRHKDGNSQRYRQRRPPPRPAASLITTGVSSAGGRRPAPWRCWEGGGHRSAVLRPCIETGAASDPPPSDAANARMEASIHARRALPEWVPAEAAAKPPNSGRRTQKWAKGKTNATPTAVSQLPARATAATLPSSGTTAIASVSAGDGGAALLPPPAAGAAPVAGPRAEEHSYSWPLGGRRIGAAPHACQLRLPLHIGGDQAQGVVPYPPPPPPSQRR